MDGRLVEKTPRDFGLVRWRWTCDLLTPVLRVERGVTIAAHGKARVGTRT
ncbi:MAG: hypothetical protein NZ899_14810 [Thermoguttaceae bacterium]|nr:hypothetical protein [Thermoguttaceae bacterium]MDW8080203.1 hypothetical protein [Thermoguttaceae bacterium]